MLWILKIILFPISFVLSILTAFFKFSFGIGTALLYIVMTVCMFAAFGLFFMSHNPKAAIETLTIGFLLSPYGLTMTGTTVTAFIGLINEKD